MMAPRDGVRGPLMTPRDGVKGSFCEREKGGNIYEHRNQHKLWNE
jgi:hypothetical protein